MAKIKKYFSLLAEMTAEWKWLFRYVARYKGIVLLYILISLVGTAMSLGSTVASKFLIDAVISRMGNVIVLYGGLVVGLALANIGFRGISSWITAKVGTKTNNEIRSEIYEKLICTKWENISRYHSGDLLNRIEGDVATVSGGIIGFIPSAVTNVLSFFGSLAIVLYYDKTMAVLSLLSAPLLFFSSHYLIKKMREFNKESRELNGKVLSYSSESMQNIQFIKSFDLSERYIENFKSLLETYRNVKLEYEKFSVFITALLSVVGLIVSYSCYGWGVYRLWQNAITYGTMTLFLALSGRLTSGFGSLVSLVPSAISIATSAGRIMEVTSYEKEKDSDAEKAKKMVAETEKSGITLQVQNVSFTYKDAENSVLKDVSFFANPGETVALVGPSGEGKTTVLKLLLGLVEPANGKITLLAPNGESIAVSDSTRRFCSYVPQEVSVSSGTVAENLLLGNPFATGEEMMNALKAADAWDFVNSLPKGIHTELKEQASNLSRGQAQRIAIARALLRRSRILLMDEATSALDGETEKRVLQNIMVTDPAKICIITTHRESMLKYCDRIYSLKSDGTLETVKG